MARGKYIGLFAAALLAMSAASVAAQPAAIQPNPQIQVEYVKPILGAVDPAQYRFFERTYEWLRIRRPLEELSIFLAPLKLPRSIKIQVDSCGNHQRLAYLRGHPVTICYELIDKIQKVAADIADSDVRQKVLVGTFIQVVLHETAYAVFDVLQVPVWGREDDAADRLAAFVLLQFPGDVATQTILGAAEFFLASSRTWTGSEFAEDVSPEAQRFYNFLCIAYGGDSLDFRGWTLAARGQDPLLPQQRAGQCVHEYDQVRHAFDLRIMPYIDPDLMLQVKATQWLRPQELAK